MKLRGKYLYGSMWTNVYPNALHISAAFQTNNRFK